MPALLLSHLAGAEDGAFKGSLLVASIVLLDIFAARKYTQVKI